MDQRDMSEIEQEPETPTPSPAWERDTLEKVLLASLTEQRQARRWGIFFKLLMLAYFGVALWLVAQPLSDQRSRGEKSHTAVIDVAGMIAAGEKANADAIIEGLRAAAEAVGAKGIILRMNTPGGSPVQSAYVYEEIRRIKKLKPELPIYAVVADMCTSGGYYIASAADKIFVNQSSIVGSIGVIMDSFGFVDAINKLGIERRVMTAGEHKAILDPFSPVDPVAKEHVQSVLNAIHQQFIDAVRQGRAGRLKENTPELYSGLVWTGDEGIKLGLADGLGDVRSVAESVIGAKDMVNYTPEENLWDRVTSRIGITFGHMLRTAVSAGPYLN
ncbi:MULTISPECIES: S49 family peptidase [Methylocaldum]|jgi:protease-4|uniref:S49 family peptidase n=1 Tax=unclassified Methylocaldum TaxID=2622260 RepID=UPI001B439D50|nr:MULTISPECIES: S49 family peptidase [unclassified Methylocaldum]MBP1148581.1 protease-4 [Methylocaldum sp. RMAD-M]